MLHLPSRFAAVILSFAPLFFQRSWQHAEVLLIGAILAPGKRTVTSLLQISGLAQERRFVNYHRAQPGGLEPPGSVTPPAGAPDHDLRTGRAGRPGPRRHD